jgi:hypothetical protein
VRIAIDLDILALDVIHVSFLFGVVRVPALRSLPFLEDVRVNAENGRQNTRGIAFRAPNAPTNQEKAEPAFGSSFGCGIFALSPAPLHVVLPAREERVRFLSIRIRLHRCVELTLRLSHDRLYGAEELWFVVSTHRTDEALYALFGGRLVDQQIAPHVGFIL